MRSAGSSKPLQPIALTAALTAAFVIGGCSSATIPQPDVRDLLVAPDSARVDLAMPTFSNPTNVTNPLFPVSSQASVLMVGTVGGKPFRTEVTLLPDTRIIEWDGHQVEVLVSQYMAFLDGRIEEVAYDFYAQADDGSVWYFGEDVYNFAEGAIRNTHGSWMAGRDGPAAMIMPANPKAGEVYRTENIPGLVFEEVTVQEVGQTLEGPLGPIEGGIVVRELHMDGATEDKTFAPGYGEFFTSDGADTEALAMAVPTDAASASMAEGPVTIATEAAAIFEAADAESWGPASAASDEINAAWTDYAAGDVPRLLEPLMDEALEVLHQAIAHEDAPAARQAAIDVSRWALDLQLRYRPVTEVDTARFDLWLAQLQVDAAAEDEANVNGDLLTLDYVRDRIFHTFDASAGADLNTGLEELQTAVGDGDLVAAAAIAQGLQDMLGR